LILLPFSISPAMAEAVYSVWAIPPEGVTQRLKKMMSGLRSEFGGPEFEPHITVVGATRLTREDAIRKLRSACAAGGLRTYTARISAVSRGGFFYQCVYLLVEPTPEVRPQEALTVMAASAHCCDHFEYEKATPYMPHLSLLYGDLSDDVKERAVERAKELDENVCGLSFPVTMLALYKTDTEDKTLKSWEKVAVCDLSGDGAGCQLCEC
ncbi:hypothetical protein Taro_043282, partial [Colocasia esculenta]|nr:hypothetical protein [Colocasia esculenta]